jgi:hypothetical protein
MKYVEYNDHFVLTLVLVHKNNYENCSKTKSQYLQGLKACCTSQF